MYGHILISTDGSEVAQHGVDTGLALASHLGARVTVVVATEPFPLPSRTVAAGWVASASDKAGFEESQKQFAEDVLGRVREAAGRLGVPASTVHVPDAIPATAIVETARSQGCDLIVMASHGRRGLGRLLLGSQTAEVLAHSTVPVLVVR